MVKRINPNCHISEIFLLIFHMKRSVLSSIKSFNSFIYLPHIFTIKKVGLHICPPPGD